MQPGTERTAVAFPGKADFTAMIAAQVAGISTAPLIPFMVGGLIKDYGWTPSLAGLAISVQLVVATIAALLTALMFSRFDARRLVLAATLLTGAANLYAAFHSDVTPLLLSRFVAGIGQGALLAMAAAAAARTGRAERVYAGFSIVVGVYAVIVLVVTPWLLQTHKVSAVFLVLAAVDLGVLPVLLRFPALQGGAPGRMALAGMGVRSAGIVAAIVCVALGAGALMAFLERLGQAAGVEAAAVGKVLATAAGLGIVAPLVVLALGTRFGRALPLVIGGAVLCVIALLFATTSSPLPYLAGAALLAPTNQFLIPYWFGVLALADSSGRLAAAGPAFLTSGVSVGPLLGGLTVDAFGMPGLGWLAAAAFSAGSVVLVLLVGRLERPSPRPNLNRESV